MKKKYISIQEWNEIGIVKLSGAKIRSLCRDFEDFGKNDFAIKIGIVWYLDKERFTEKIINGEFSRWLFKQRKLGGLNGDVSISTDKPTV